MSRSTAPRELAGVIGQGLRAAVLRRPAAVAAPLAPSRFLLLALLFLAAGLGLDAWTVAAPREFNGYALGERSAALLIAMLAGGAVATLAGRPALWLRLAAVGLVAMLPLQVAWTIWLAPWSDPFEPSLLEAAIAVYVLLVALVLLFWAGSRRARPVIMLGAGAGPATLLAIYLLHGTAWWWPSEDAPALPELSARTYSAEALLYRQPELLSTALQQLQPQRPDRIDLYALAFGGDGNEPVFLNEVAYFERLAAQRFDAAGRTVGLANHPATLQQRPLATLTNLRHALHGIGQRMDREQDLLLLYLTSHGSEDHRLYVALHDLPLDQITPEELDRAIDDAGIRWRVVIVSACYSGGFIDALRNEHTLVLTAARHDRPSFGCGSASDITWFAQALLAEALNETTDFISAFDSARKTIRRRERAEDEQPSRPQIAVGDAISDQLDAWRAGFQPGPAVPFEPVSHDDDGHGDTASAAAPD